MSVAPGARASADVVADLIRLNRNKWKYYQKGVRAMELIVSGLFHHPVRSDCLVRSTLGLSIWVKRSAIVILGLSFIGRVMVILFF